MEKCDSYRLRVKSEHAYDPFSGQCIAEYDRYIGFCNATRERDECSCGGDRVKCTFYPEYRANGGAGRFSCQRNKNGLFVVCKNCTAPCFVNRLIRERAIE